MRIRATTIVIALCLCVSSRSSHAFEMPVSYDVDAKALKSGAAVGTMLTFDIHSALDCSDAPVDQRALPIEDVTIEAVKRVVPRGAAKPPKTVRIKAVFIGAAPPSGGVLLRVTGSGVVAVGSECQPQSAQGSDLTCGNGMIDGLDECEAGDLDGHSCAALPLGYPLFGYGGTLRCGAGCRFDTTDCRAERYVEHGDGTVTDNLTGRMWAKTDDAGGLTDKDNTYTWSAGGSAPDGTAFTEFLVGMNGRVCSSGSGGVCPSFAGYSDWRLPTLEELQSIRYPLCGVLPCLPDYILGPVQPQPYFTATERPGAPSQVWRVWFDAAGGNGADTNLKTEATYVRAVR